MARVPPPVRFDPFADSDAGPSPRRRVQPSASGTIAVRWIVVAVLSVAVPAAAIAASTPMELPTPAVFQGVPGDPATDIFAPVDDSVELRVEREGTTARLTWRDDTSWHANVFYRVYRHDGPGPDTSCYISGGVALYCYVTGTPVATTRDTTFVDTPPPRTPPTGSA